MTDYKITRRDPSKVYPKLPKILVGDNEETLVIYGDIDMTDYSELIRKARAVPGPTMLTTYPARTTPDPLSNALADALEAQAKQIADLAAALDDMHKGHDAICKYVSELEAALKMAADDLDAAAKFTNFNVYHIAANQARAALNGERG